MTTQSLECARPPGRAQLERVETDLFQRRLKHQTPRQVDINFEEMVERFKEHKRIFEEKLALKQKEEEKRYQLLQT